LLFLTSALAVAWPAMAQSRLTPIKVSAGPLPRTLQEIARQTGAELLFDRNLVAGRQAPRIEANTTAIAALRMALAGANLSVRQAASGALIIEAATTPPLAEPDVAVSELLVIGRHTQNFDIRRQELDIQPYRVFTGEQITSAHVDDLGQFFDTRVTTNTTLPLATSGLSLTANSVIDLRGLGPDQTLVLIDGRRMPDFPNTNFGFTQTDLNALPLHAVDRVETLTGSAGGIYGFGALGGVVNVVLAHDRPGAETYVTAGVTSRGDAGRVAFEGRVEFSPDHGATEVMLDVGFSRSAPLTNGQRGYVVRDRTTTYRVDPSDDLLLAPHGNAIDVWSLGDENLVLKPEYGGAALGSTVTFLPRNFEGAPADLAAALIGHAGQYDLSLSPEDAASYVAPNPKLGSVLLNVRHQFGGGVEAYFDGIMLWDHSVDVDHNAPGTELLLFPSSPLDPFEQAVFVTYPGPATAVTKANLDSSRFTFGVVAPLPREWRATAEATWGQARFKGVVSDTLDFGPPDGLNPFGSWTQFEQALINAQQSGYEAFDTHTNYLEQSVRLAGPVFRTPAGPATLTLLAEHRTETIPSYAATITGVFSGLAQTGPFAPQTVSMTSLYAELRSRVFAEAAPSPLLKGLEVQLAVRNDRQTSDFSTVPTDLTAPRLHITAAGTSYTVGAKVTPLPWLMLRASFATGQTPPPEQALITTTDFGLLTDPKRGGDFAFVPAENTGGSPNLKNIRASTASVGVVLTPFGPRGPRVSVDYSHISKTGDVEFLNDQTVVDNEDALPQRVQRGPLTDEDRALGYTAGPITFVDATAINGISTRVQTLDTRFDWSFPVRWGWLHLYSAATYNFDKTVKPVFESDVQFDGYYGGPLYWRVDGGFDWSIGSLTIGANVQYYDSYNINSPGSTDDLQVALQGSDHIPAQTYLDLHVSKRFHRSGGLASDLKVDVGLSNVLDTSPPRAYSNLGIGAAISPYGDPRRRRFEVALSALF
jgi:outer membrane receptor protein involved in Fe transport